MDNQPFAKVKASSTLEWDDAVDVVHRGFVFDGQCDSGIASIPDCCSVESGSSRFNSAVQRSTDSRARSAAALVDRLNELSISDKQLKTATEVDAAKAEWEYENFASTENPLARFPSGSPDQSVWNYSSQQTAFTTTADPFEQDDDGDTSLHLSIIQSNPSLAIRLIELGQFTDQLDIQNDHLLTALHLAVITDQPHLVRALLLSGASLTVRDKEGNSPLHLACKYGRAQCVERLTAPPSAEEEQYLWRERLKKGLEPRAMNSMRSKDFDSLNYEGDSCLHLALMSVSDSKYETINYLLNVCGADINVQEGKSGFSPLHLAVRSRDCVATQFLLSNPSTAVNQRCYNGSTALDFAFAQQNNRLADQLLGHGAVSFAATSSSSSNADDTENDEDVEIDDLVIVGNCPKSGSSFR